MKYRYLFILFFSSFSVTAQNNTIVKFFDSFWLPTSHDSAFYISNFVKTDAFYRCTSFRATSKKLVGISYYTDTAFSKCIGLFRKYYESGQLQDSSYYDNETGGL